MGSPFQKSQELVLWFNGRTFALHGKASQKLQKKLSKFALNDLYQNNNKIHLKNRVRQMKMRN